MNWNSLIRFRKQVEDMIREELSLAEWKKSQEEARREALQQDMHTISLELARHLEMGVGKVFANQRFDWLEDHAKALERLTRELKLQEEKIASLRDKLREAHQARRTVEMIHQRKQSVRVKIQARKEQEFQDETSLLRYAASNMADREK